MQTTQTCEGDEFIKRDFNSKPTFRFNPGILDLVVSYSELSQPVDRDAMLRKIESFTVKCNNTTQEEGGDQTVVTTETIDEERANHGPVLKFHGWEVPNAYVMFQTYKLHKRLKQSYP